MSFPAAPGLPGTGPASAPPDPFGLWEAPAQNENGGAGEGGVAFSPGQDGSLPAVQLQGAVVWRLDLSSVEGGQAWLDQRAKQVTAIETGLDQANGRLDIFLEQRKRRLAAGGVSFDTTGQPAAEAELGSLLEAIEAPAEVSFGIGDLAKQASGAVGVDWEVLQQRLADLMGSVTRQMMYMAWVDTRVDQRLVARTTIDWGSDMTSLLLPDLAADHRAAHRQSLGLAVASRAANLRTVSTVVQVAGKIVAAVSTPLGAAQALALGWQFVHEVVMPLLKDAKQ